MSKKSIQSSYLRKQLTKIVTFFSVDRLINAWLNIAALQTSVSWIQCLYKQVLSLAIIPPSRSLGWNMPFPLSVFRSLFRLLFSIFPLSQRAREHVVCLFVFLAVVGSKWMFPAAAAAFVSLTGSYIKEGGVLLLYKIHCRTSDEPQ